MEYQDGTGGMRNTDREPAERREEIEKSLRKKFRKSIMSKFARAISDYDLLQPGDHVAVCISGGKDSMLMAKLFRSYADSDPARAFGGRRAASYLIFRSFHNFEM